MGNNTAQNLIKFSYFDPFNVFGSVRKELEDRLPFRNLHWKPLNESLRTISSLPVKIVGEADDYEGPESSSKPFIMFLVISCTSIDEYRAKVRPLVRQWLPDVELDTRLMPAKRVVLLHSNSDVSETNLFKTVSFFDKFSKDFPYLTAIEVKSIYRSEKQKTDFWNGTLAQLRKYTMEVFEQRLALLEVKLREVPSDKIVEITSLQEKILNLFLSFYLNDEASRELESLRTKLLSKLGPKLPSGNLEIPFAFLQNEQETNRSSIALQVANQNLTTYELNKFFFLKHCELIQKSYVQAPRNVRLYQLAKTFLRTIQRAFKSSPLLAEFKASFIETLFDISMFDREASVTFREIGADFKMIARDCFLDMAFASNNFRIFGRNYSSLTRKSQLSHINSTFKDEETFHQTIFSMTKDIIRLLSESNSKKYRTVDLLSVEIGLLHYQRNEYEQAISILQSCHEYYKESNWSTIAFPLLECFIDCLVKSPGIETLIICGEQVPTATILSNSILDLLTSAQPDDRKEYWWDRFLAMNEKDNGSLMYPLDNLFDIQVDGKLVVTRPNVFGLCIKVFNKKIPKEVFVKSMQLLLRNSHGESMIFQLLDCCVKPGENVLFLESARISFGTFSLVSTESTVGNTIFCKEFTEDAEKFLELERPIESNSFELIVSPSRHLETAKNSVTLNYFNRDDISTFKLVLTALPMKNESNSNVSFNKEGDQFSIVIDNFNVKALDYFILHSCDNFMVKQEMTFETRECPGVEFYQCDSKTISCILPVSVSVEDIARDGCFFFKFLVNSSTPKEPILLHGSELLADNTDKYNVHGGFAPDIPLLIKNGDDDTCLTFFQVETKGHKLFDSKDIFHLRVTFNILKDQIDHLVTNVILIQGNPQTAAKMESHRDVWNSMVLKRLVFDYELFEHKSYLQLISPESCINELEVFLQSKIQDKDFLKASSRCLRVLQKGFQFSYLEIVEYTKDILPSVLVVHVSLPTLSRFFSVNLTRDDSEGSVSQLGHIIPYTIKVKNLSRHWQTQNSAGRDYIFELFNSNEWLIDGKRRFCLLPSTEEYRVNIIPLRRGYLKFPKVEITESDRKVSELHYLNMHEVTLVI
ncbi:LANO_0H17128g1_1 [Lachancea nothofagi CBS 11611]|uniref:LANO_0H17128g1_1 n=1 Tax=Lachancea nothofagi CBS 11611 TaxID=1266666 RepID=A0A1G4KMZ2_9SACH|nr:LANO_0H17128g1_1 [Lachancea nothofagi CBS 11611]